MAYSQSSVKAVINVTYLKHAQGCCEGHFTYTCLKQLLNVLYFIFINAMSSLQMARRPRAHRQNPHFISQTVPVVKSV